ncbi:ABC transporter substrate-binding protein [Pikeienuella piscinae]|uniref:ABC transporter substrate-binding protein n=1 Tax=Pikeienuella piscinae TaxID=2748098 RepID=A0A7L5C1R5_9RHOB|nr:ABC transporter substrate-binding protein [Pikeienuella piscinae]QIE56757.1 ABC transporter substrate-binding protein [Pikeienuella piscinae]
MLTSFADGAVAQNRFQPAEPEPGVEIPSATVNFGMRPYADNTFYVIAMKKGWFEEVGVTIGPDELGMKVNDTNVNALLLNGQLDLASQYCPLMLPTYRSSDKLKCIAFTDTFLGAAILANPELGLKPVSEYIEEGMSFEDAMAKGLAPLEGKTLIVPPVISNRPFTDAAAEFSGVDWDIEVLEDARSLVLARSGQIDFVNPEGAPVVYTLMQAGWTRVLGIGDLFAHAPGGAGSSVAPLVAIVGVGANADYVNENQNTVLRFLSVVWRTIDAVGKDPSLYELQAPYLNSVAGTDLDAKGLEATVAALHPFAPFEDGETYFRDPESVLYYGNAWGALIEEFTEKGILPDEGMEPDDIVWAASIWKQMSDYRVKSEELIEALEGETLSDEAGKLLEQAKLHYERFNYLDAYRFAAAAKG